MAFGIPTNEIKGLIERTHVTLEKSDRVLDASAKLVEDIGAIVFSIRIIMAVAAEAIASQRPHKP